MLSQTTRWMSEFTPRFKLTQNQLSSTKTWGKVAQSLERATDNRVIAASNPTEAVWKLWQFPLHDFASVFRKRHNHTKSRWSLLSGFYARGSERYHTGGKGGASIKLWTFSDSVDKRARFVTLTSVVSTVCIAPN